MRIGALDYVVLWEPVDWEIGQRLFGQCVPDSCEIHISERCVGHRLACVFAHEVAHAMAAWEGCYDKADCEEIAYLASYSMVMFWRDNPEAFDWWISLVKGTPQ
jgi:hypothetical protein